MLNVDQSARLLRLFRAIPKKRRQRTFLQIAGNPHYENVSSNILAFFLDPENEHGLGDIVLRAFLTCLGESDVSISSVKVRREEGPHGKRLDIWVVGDAFVLGIENKIWHHIANPLDMYATAIDDIAGSARRPFKVVLSPRIITDPGEMEKLRTSGFVSITYPALFSSLKPLIGHHGHRADVRYLTYLNDFISTMEDLIGANPADQRATAFFQENGPEIDALAEQYRQFKAKQFEELSSYLQDIGDDSGPVRIKSWVAQCDGTQKIWVRFQLDDLTMQIDTFFHSGVWVTAIYSVKIQPTTVALTELRARVLQTLETNSEWQSYAYREKWGLRIHSPNSASLRDVGGRVRKIVALIQGVMLTTDPKTGAALSSSQSATTSNGVPSM